jgi:hypothetical protein
MANPQLVTYIKEQTGKFSKEAIIQALVASGWQLADINAALAEVEGVKEPAPPSAGLPASATNNFAQAGSNFIAEMQKHREEAQQAGVAPIIEGSTQIRPSTLPSYSGTTPTGQTAPTQKGIIGMLMKTGFIKNEQQANMAMIAFICAMLGIIAWVLWL